MLLTAVDPGFDPNGTVVANLALPDQSYPEDEDVRGLYDELLERLRSYPEVEKAGGVLTLPMRWNMRGTLWISVEGMSQKENEQPAAGYQLVTPGYFEALRIPLLRGRLIDSTDDAEAPPNPLSPTTTSPPLVARIRGLLLDS